MLTLPGVNPLFSLGPRLLHTGVTASPNPKRPLSSLPVQNPLLSHGPGKTVPSPAPKSHP